MSETKFKPCPFCGCVHAPVMQGNGCGDNWLECRGCGASTRLREDGAGSVEDWNRRAPAFAGYVIELLIAAGHVSAEKVAQAREIAALAHPSAAT